MSYTRLCSRAARSIAARAIAVGLMFWAMPALTGPAAIEGLRGTVYGGGAMELFWNRTANAHRVEVARDGEVLGQTEGVSWFIPESTLGFSHRFSLTAIDHNGARSSAAQIQLRYDGDQVLFAPEEAATVDRPQSDLSAPMPEVPAQLRGVVYGGGAMEWFWEKHPDASAFAIEVNGRSLGVQQRYSYFLDASEAHARSRLSIRAVNRAGQQSEPVELELLKSNAGNAMVYSGRVPQSDPSRSEATEPLQAPMAIQSLNLPPPPEEPQGDFTLEADSGNLLVVEGGAAVFVDLRIGRLNGHDLPIELSAHGAAPALQLKLESTRLSGESDTTRLWVQQAIGAAPIKRSERQFEVVARDTVGRMQRIDVRYTIEPSGRADIYLLIGQSNMVGSSGQWSRQDGVGSPDEPHPRIFQLNVPANHDEQLLSPSWFTDPQLQAVEPHYVSAQDPLHMPLQRGSTYKWIGPVGLGLSFAKAALADTESDIVLIPAAWSGSGFCPGEITGQPASLGWNAPRADGSRYGGGLLFDRAVARVNRAIRDTGGILRGILWLQGETDATPYCAGEYAGNLERLASGLRSRIMVDARGPAARGPSADIPFVVGTLSRGADARGDHSQYSPTLIQVDDTLRAVASLLPHAGVVINDDLVPPAYPCGYHSCVHFGAEALREMGRRYYGETKGIMSRSAVR